LWWVFWDRISWTLCPGWLWASIFLISASWVARITGESHQRSAKRFFFNCFNECWQKRIRGHGCLWHHCL
jgi:hypothetical protein